VCLAGRRCVSFFWDKNFTSFSMSASNR
jgi:hypothetical protein